MRSRKSTLIVYAAFSAALLIGLSICGKQIMTATDQIVETQNARIEKQNARYAEIEKALHR